MEVGGRTHGRLHPARAGSLCIQAPINYSIEFTGGTLMQLEFRQPPDVGELRSALAAAGVRGAEIQQFGSTDRIHGSRTGSRVRCAAQDTAAGSVAAANQTCARDELRSGQRHRSCAPRLSGRASASELRRNALIAILISFVITLIYLAFRFEWRFGARGRRRDRARLPRHARVPQADAPRGLADGRRGTCSP